MADFKQRFDSKKQEWPTPDLLYCPLNAEFDFSLDLAASKENAKCQRFFDRYSNGLSRSWANETCFLNPPYGDLNHKMSDWVKKAWEESEFNSAVVVMLIPARTNTKWWAKYCMRAAEVRFICGRPKFGNADHGLPLPLVVVVFRKHAGDTKYSSLLLADGKALVKKEKMELFEGTGDEA